MKCNCFECFLLSGIVLGYEYIRVVSVTEYAHFSVPDGQFISPPPIQHYLNNEETVPHYQQQADQCIF